MSEVTAPLRHTDRFYIGGQWVAPSSDATIKVIDSDTEQVYFTVPEAQAADISRAAEAAREAFDAGPWPWLTPQERAEYLRALGAELKRRSEDVGQIWPRESGVLHAIARHGGAGAEQFFTAYAALADTYTWEEPAKPTAGGEFGLLVREPVGVVGAIIPWNVPATLIANKVAPALLAGCTVILKSSPEAPGEAYLLAEAAEAVGLPAGVLNVVTADREVSGLLVRDPRVDKISFTGSTAAERQRDRVEGYIAKGIADGATLATGGGRPKDLDRGWYVEPTVFGNVDNSSVIAQEEIFGPVLSVVPAADEDDAVRIANDTIYGLNASVFTNDVNRARQVASRLRSGTVGHNAMRTDFGVSFGGYKQSGIGREGVHEGLANFLEVKYMILEGQPEGYEDTAL
jgi:acyl-CoA reductase-like NAD-dependent aldehyde dehydrogenase